MAVPIAHGGGLMAARRRFPDAAGAVARPVDRHQPRALPRAAACPPAWPRACRSRGRWRRWRPPPPGHTAWPTRPACVAAPGTQALIHLLPRLLSPRRGGGGVAPPTASTAAGLGAGRALGSPRCRAWPARRSRPCWSGPTTRTGAVAEAGFGAGPGRPLGRAQRAAGGGRGIRRSRGAAAWAPPCRGRGLLLLRSFGKTYGLAGLRLGFALAEPGWAAALREALGPWAVSGPALHAGLHALPDAGWRVAAGTRLAAEAERLDGLLRRERRHGAGRHPLVSGWCVAARPSRWPTGLERRGCWSGGSTATRTGCASACAPPDGWARLEDALILHCP